MGLLMDAYTTGQLQTSLSLLEQGNPVTIADELRAEIARRTFPVIPVESSVTLTPCPTPGCSGYLHLWPRVSRDVGWRVLGCQLCSYSRMESK